VSRISHGSDKRCSFEGSADKRRRHVGRVAVPSQTGGCPPLASTKVPLPGEHLLFGADNSEERYVESQVMNRDDIKAVIGQFAQAARNAIRAGFDGVEMHGAKPGYDSCEYCADKLM
jgi:2,4-dienoyl-CoA reductase-like NADH-dependent reductase (Old Yellow Enzyme family)